MEPYSFHGIDLSQVDIAIKNPSISDESDFIKKIIAQNIPIETDVSLLFKLVPPSKIIGITGTKGKSTTSTMVFNALQDQGEKVVLCGNIGIPVFENFESYSNCDWLVIELSSYMNVSLHRYGLSPHILAVTSLSQDHLVYHGGFEGYIEDKLSILGDQQEGDITFANQDCTLLKENIDRRGYKVKYYSGNDIKILITTNLRGSHYLSNISAVFNICSFALGEKFNLSLLQKTILNFKTLHSRMETMLVQDGIEYLNNSKATDTGSFCADLATLITEKKSIYIICGGEEKGLDLANMGRLINNDNVVKVALINNVGSKRLAELLHQEKILGYYNTIESAFQDLLAEIERNKTENNVIILMPGTGTYGLFRNKEGSDSFNLCVDNLKK